MCTDLLNSLVISVLFKRILGHVLLWHHVSARCRGEVKKNELCKGCAVLLARPMGYVLCTAAPLYRVYGQSRRQRALMCRGFIGAVVLKLP